MKKRGILKVGSIIGVMAISLSFYLSWYYIGTVDGNDEEGIKKSIAYLHKSYIDRSMEIEIIDEFNYDNDKVILFSNNDLKGIAKFYKDNKGDFKIGFVETIDDESNRSFSKVK